MVKRSFKSFRLLGWAVAAGCIVIAGRLEKSALAQTPVHNSNLCVTDGQVEALAAHGNVVYIGGDFNVVGPYTGGGVPVSCGTGLPFSDYAEINGIVHACVSDGAGGWYVGGEFTEVGGEQRSRLAHITSSGQVSAWAPDVRGTAVYALAVSPDGSTVYIGGAFTNIGGYARNCLAAVAADTAAVTAWNPAPGNEVRALAVAQDGATVFAGGAFTNIGPAARNYIAAWDTATGNPTTWAPNLNGEVRALAFSPDGGVLYVGGKFTQVGVVPRKYTASFAVPSASPRPWAPDASSDVYALAVSPDGATVYAGGAFTNIGGQARSYIAALNSTNGAAADWAPEADASVYALTVSLDGSTVYAGGAFVNIGGGERYSLAALDAAAGAATGWELNANDCVRALAFSSDGSALYVGGDFSGLGCVLRRGIAAVDNATGLPLDYWNARCDGYMATLCLSPDGERLYVGGMFTEIGGVPRLCIAALDTATANAVAGWAPDAAGPIFDLALSPTGGVLYAAGAFMAIGGQPRSFIGALNLETGLATDWAPVPDAVVFGLAVSPDGRTVYAGGMFTDISGIPRFNIVALDSESAAPVAGWAPDADGTVWKLRLSHDNSSLYAIGDFANIGGEARNGLAALDPAGTGSALTWDPRANDFAVVFALATASTGGPVYVGGDFGHIGGANRPRLAALDPVTALASDWTPEPDDMIWALALTPDNSSLYVGGSFTAMSSQRRHCLAKFDLMPVFYILGTNGAPVASGADPSQESGTDFGGRPWGSSTAHGFTIVNNSALTLNINGVTITGLQDSEFAVDDMPRSVGPFSAAQFHAVFAPPSVEQFAVSVIVSNDGAQNPFVLNLAGAGVKRDQAISVPYIPPQWAPRHYALAASASSGLPVSFEVLSGPGRLLDETTLALTGTGVVSVAARQAGNELWNPAPDEIINISIYRWRAASGTDYNGSGRSLMAVYHEPSGTWYMRDVEGTWFVFGMPWGGPGFTPVPGDYDGDGECDLAVYHELSGTWYIADVQHRWFEWNVPWGGPGFQPVQGDYNGDGKSDLAVYHEQAARWYIRDLPLEWVVWGLWWGGESFTPVYGDYNGDGAYDLAVYQQDTGLWYLKEVEGTWFEWGVPWGGPGFTPVPGDYNADGAFDLCVYHAETGAWYIKEVSGAWFEWGVRWGGPYFTPVPGDYDGDGASDKAVYHELTGTWYVLTAAGEVFVFGQPWGGPGFSPVF